jgi:hypothetical protein
MIPEEVRNAVIKSIYPSISNEEKVLVGLLKRGAVSEKTVAAIPEGLALARLVNAKPVGKAADGKYYLTANGQMIAKGALSLYPELQEF